MSDHKLVPVEPTEEMKLAGRLNGSRWLPLVDADWAVKIIYKAMLAAAPTTPEISSASALRALVEAIRDEPCATGEPAESVQIGRLQVADELEALIERLTSSIPDTTALKGQ